MARYQPRHTAPAAHRRTSHTTRQDRILQVLAVLLAVSVVATGAIIAVVHFGPGHGSSKAAASVSAPGGPVVGASAPVPEISATSVFPSADGMEANWVVDENRKPGTSAWQLAASAGGASIEGYADHTSAQVGDTVTLYVSTSAPSFHVAAFRMGYYGGAGARLIWTSPELAGDKQQRCPLTRRTNMVECSWRPSISTAITSTWPQGDYLFKLIADPGQQSYIPLTIWDPTSHATYVIQNSVLTWQAWNDYGGYSNFGGLARSGPSPNFADRSVVLSFDRPYSKGLGAADFGGLELPLVRFAEQHGLDVTYWTDIDLSEHPQLITNHKAILSLGHNEFVTAQERQGEIDGLKAGVNLAFFGATPDLRPARLQSSRLGPDREMVAYRDARQDPLSRSDPRAATPNTWDEAPLDRPASQIVGDTYGGYGINAPLVVITPDAWPFAGTGLKMASQLQHVVLGDYDNYLPGPDSPANVEILAHSPVVTSYGHHGKADMTYYTDPKADSGVFATGTIGWIPALSPCPPTVADSACPAAAVAAITANVLRLFGAGPAGVGQPSAANWRKLYSA